MTHSSVFVVVAERFCKSTAAHHCLINSFVVFPVLAICVLLFPFAYRLCDARISPNKASSSSSSGSSREEQDDDDDDDFSRVTSSPLSPSLASIAGSVGVGVGAGGAETGVGKNETGWYGSDTAPHTRRSTGAVPGHVQAYPLALLQTVASVLLAVIPIGVLILQERDVIIEEPVHTGTYLWAIGSAVAWLLNAGLVLTRGSYNDQVPDYLQLWWVVAFCTEVAKVVITAIDHSDDSGHKARSFMNASAGVQAGLVFTMAAPAAYRLFSCSSVLNCLFCCCRRSSTAGERTGLLSATYNPMSGTGNTPLNASEQGGSSATQSPYLTAGVLSRAFFMWATPLMRLGFKRPLEAEDIPPLREANKSTFLSRLFHLHWRRQVRSAATKSHQKGTPVDPSVARALISATGQQFYAAALFKLCYDLLVFVGPYLLNAVIDYLQDPDASSSTGYAYVAVMFTTAFFQTLLLHQYFFRVFLVGQNLRSSVILAVYRKALRLSVGARQSKSVGQVVNIMSTDAQRMQDLTTYLQMLWSAPLQIALSIYFLWQQLGPSVFAGVAVMVLFSPLQGCLARYLKRLQTTLMGVKDKRVNLTNEALSGIKLIKYSAWEGDFISRIRAIRTQELKHLTSYLVFNALTRLAWTGLPLIVSLVTFLTYTVAGHTLTASKAFTSLALFNVLRFPMAMAPNVINNIVEARVSLSRIGSFLMAPEVDNSASKRLGPLPPPQFDPTMAAGGGDSSTAPAPPAKHCAVSVEAGNFMWEDAESEEGEGGGSSGGSASSSSDKPASGKASAKHPDLTRYNSLAGVELASATPTSLAQSIPGSLHDIDFKAPRGALVCIVGSVGSGKSNLLHALLGEMTRISGDVSVRGSVAYVAQTAFILNATVKDNILFGRPFSASLYERAIRVSSLTADLDILPAGDRTEIGERGINLSGGQRQRVSLARAVYADADVYLLDDPLSAVDAHVGSAIFKDCICGALASKTRILVTHGLQFISEAQQVYVLDNGRVAEKGTYRELVAVSDSLLSAVVATYEAEAKEAYLEAQEEADAVAASSSPVPLRRRGSSTSEAKAGDDDEDSDSDSDSDDAGESKSDPSAKPSGSLVTKENRERGNVSLDVFKYYAKVCGGYAVVVILLLLYAVAQGSQALGNWWLSHWASSVDDGVHNSTYFLRFYAGIVIGSLGILFCLQLFVAFTGIRASRRLHDDLLSTMLRGFMSFFDTTPIGRILNRFSQDVYTVDETLPSSFHSFFNTFFSIISTVVVISSVTPYFLFAVVPLAVVYIGTQRYYVATSRELKRLDSVSRSPIYAHFSETLQGTVTIRAYGEQHRFLRDNAAKLDTNQSAYFAGTTANRWLATRLEVVGSLVVTASALFAVLDRKNISPSLAGLSITYALSITQTLNWMVRMSSQIETQIVSVERMKEYASLPTEPEGPSGANPDSQWPSAGRIVFEDVKLRYRFGTPYVLKGVSCEIQPGEKIGICGRTGAGKSSLISALYRLVDVLEGNIVIDGQNISQIDLALLRSRIAIIPQEPTLFAGTLRRNLDPLDQHSDSDILDALELVSLRSLVLERPQRLETPMAEGGENWSHGQRQLICMARALLLKCRIVILDEATAACDVDTDALLQRTIRKVFQDCTVLTVAHRVHTLLDSDRIMVLDKGKIIEFDAPRTLLGRSDSAFAGLMAQSQAADESMKH